MAQVLLSDDFFHIEMKPILCQWMCHSLRKSFRQKGCASLSFLAITNALDKNRKCDSGWTIATGLWLTIEHVGAFLSDMY